MSTVKIKASDVAEMLDGEPIQALDDALEEACSKMSPLSGNATLTIEIENDLEEEDEESEDEESEESES